METRVEKYKSIQEQIDKEKEFNNNVHHSLDHMFGDVEKQIDELCAKAHKLKENAEELYFITEMRKRNGN